LATLSHGWIGRRPSGPQIAAVMLVGTIGILIPGVQPIILGALLGEHRITLTQLGHAASIELLCMGGAAAAGVTILSPRYLRVACVAASLAFIASNWLTPSATGEEVTMLRGVAGIAGGVLVALASSLIARSATPDRWAAIYLTVQTVAQFFMAALMSSSIGTQWGASGDFMLLAAAGCISTLACAAIPPGFQALPQTGATAGAGIPPARGLAALCVCFLVMMFIVAAWVYFDPLALAAGLSTQVSEQAVSVSLAFQVLGGIAATALAGRLMWYPVFTLCMVADLAALVLLGMQPSATAFVVAAAVFGFIWLFVLPFLVPMLIEADESRRSASMYSGIGLLGASCGPAVASLLVRSDNTHVALWLSAGCLLLSLAIASGLHAWSRLQASPRETRLCD
jgi:predicted MFS family arabinose efflux permease